MATVYKPLPFSDFGAVYITGATKSIDFPTFNAQTDDLQGEESAFVIRLSSFKRDWATYYGGTQDEDGNEGGGRTRGLAIAAESDKNKVWFGGDTNSKNFPRTQSSDPDVFIGNSFSGFQSVKGFVVRLNGLDGTFDYGTFFGDGSGSVSRVHTMDINSDGNLLFGGVSFGGLGTNELEDNGGEFYQDPNEDGFGFIAELDLNNHLIWGTDFGNSATSVIDLDVDYEDNLVVACNVYSFPTDDVEVVDQAGINDLSITASEDPFPSVSWDAYIAKFTTGEDRQLVWATLFLGDGRTYSQEIKVNNDNEIYLVGNTLSEEFHEDIEATLVNNNSGCTDLFVAKFSHQGVLQKTMFIGGSEDEGIYADCYWGPSLGNEVISTGISFDQYDNVFITSSTESADFPVYSLSGAYEQDDLGNNGMDLDNGDAVVIVLDKNLNDKWITYFGGQSGSSSDGIKLEAGRGIEVVFDQLYLTGSTNSSCEIRIPLKDAGSNSNPAIYFYEYLNKAADANQPADQAVTDAFITVFDLGPLYATAIEVVDDSSKDGLTVFPSPANEYLTVVLPGDQNSSDVKVYDILGSCIFFANLNVAKDQPFQIPTSSLPNGVYIITIAENGISAARKFIVQHD